MDHNYRRTDSGQRHVFEIKRTYGSTYQLHFHKSGKMDTPTFSPPPQAPLETFSNSGVSQPADVSLDAGTNPTLYTMATVFDTSNGHESQPVGKHEAHTACTRILDSCPHAERVDVTDGVAFAWQRFLRTQTATRDIVGPGIRQVCVVRRPDKPALAFHRADGSICVATPSNMRTYVVQAHESAQWSPTAHASVPWLRLM